MILSLLVTLLLGVISGTLTGLTPGIHINLIGAILISASITFLAGIPPTILLVFIISMAITHTFLDFIPSIYFGAPDEDTGLSTLPGHFLLMRGEGQKAVTLTLIGSVIAIFSLSMILPAFIFIIPPIYPFIQKMMGFFLIWISIFLISHNKEKRLLSFSIFILAGFLGIASLNLNLSQPLFPLLTGLFGTSTIIYSIKSKGIIPEQILEKFQIPKKDLIKPALATIFISPISALFPGLGSSQAAIIGSTIIKNLSREQFLILIGSINTLIMSSSFIILLVLEKTRTGAANTIIQLIPLDQINIATIMVIIILTGIISIPLTLQISKYFAKRIDKINYILISYIILSFLIILIIYFTKFPGLIILIASTILGLACMELGIRRGLLMGSLLIPTIIYYLPF